MKIIVVATLLVLVCSYAFAQSTFDLDYQISGVLDVSNAYYDDDPFGNNAMFLGTKFKPGLGVSAEASMVSKNVRFGLGAEYQLPHEHETLPNGMETSLEDLAFLPLYATVGYSFPVSSGPTPELFAQIGHSLSLNDDFVEEDEEWDEITSYEFGGGMYYGFGFGLVFDKVVIQALARNSRFSVDTEIDDYGDIEKFSYKCDYRQISFRLGYRF